MQRKIVAKTFSLLLTIMLSSTVSSQLFAAQKLLKYLLCCCRPKSSLHVPTAMSSVAIDSRGVSHQVEECINKTPTPAMSDICDDLCQRISRDPMGIVIEYCRPNSWETTLSSQELAFPTASVRAMLAGSTCVGHLMNGGCAHPFYALLEPDTSTGRMWVLVCSGKASHADGTAFPLYLPTSPGETFHPSLPYEIVTYWDSKKIDDYLARNQGGSSLRKAKKWQGISLKSGKGEEQQLLYDIEIRNPGVKNITHGGTQICVRAYDPGEASVVKALEKACNAASNALSSTSSCGSSQLSTLMAAEALKHTQH